MLDAQRLRVGIALAIVGAVIGAIGSILAGVEFATATRQWFSESGSQQARVRMHQAVNAGRAARQAAYEAWQENGTFVGAGNPGHT